MKDALAEVFLPPDTLDSVVFRVATVSSTSPVEVDYGGGTGLSSAYLNSYTPATNDQVLVLQTKTDLIIIGLIQSGG